MAKPSAQGGFPDLGQLSKTDLNPLLNPLLEKNLSRWAQVYFTHPPETRDQAVLELLRELQNEEDGISTPESPATTGQTARYSSTMGASSELRGWQPLDAHEPASAPVVCPSCGHENLPEHKFCSFCGADFHQPENAAPVHRGYSTETLSVLGLSSTAPENELERLRETSFSTLDEADSGSHRWKYLVAALVIVAAGIAYVQWPLLMHLRSELWRATVSQPASSAQSQPAASAPAEPEPQPESPTVDAGQPSSTPAIPSQPQTSEAKKLDASVKAPAAVQSQDEPAAPETTSARHQVHKQPDSAQQIVTLASNSQATRSAADGSQELVLAQRYLASNGAQHDSVAAAHWLWKSVGKQNPRAAFLLADLYERGDGVSKNCDQARILLTAAAKKGVPDAATKLQNIQNGSCQ